MTLTLYYTSSENNKVNKSLSNARTVSGTLRSETDVIRPIILVEMDLPSNYNYAYIPEFNRYYYIRSVESYRTGLWMFHLEVDPLNSFKGDIYNIKAILQETESYKADSYLEDNLVWVAKVKDKTAIINFPSGLSESGQYVLITAGGG